MKRNIVNKVLAIFDLLKSEYPFSNGDTAINDDTSDSI